MIFGTLFPETGDFRLSPCWPPVLVLPGMRLEVNVSVVQKRTPNVWVLVVTGARGRAPKPLIWLGIGRLLRF